MEKAKKSNSTAHNNTSTNYLNLIKSNLTLVLTISLVIFSLTLLYAITSADIYISSTILENFRSTRKKYPC